MNKFLLLISLTLFTYKTLAQDSTSGGWTTTTAITVDNPLPADKAQAYAEKTAAAIEAAKKKGPTISKIEGVVKATGVAKDKELYKLEIEGSELKLNLSEADLKHVKYTLELGKSWTAGDPARAKPGEISGSGRCHIGIEANHTFERLPADVKSKIDAYVGCRGKLTW